jgi:hypothetical protein
MDVKRKPSPTDQKEHSLTITNHHGQINNCVDYNRREAKQKHQMISPMLNVMLQDFFHTPEHLCIADFVVAYKRSFDQLLEDDYIIPERQNEAFGVPIIIEIQYVTNHHS